MNSRLVGVAVFVYASLLVAFGHSAEQSSPLLLVVWPPNKVTVDGDRVRVGGRTNPDAKVTVNGRTLRVFRSGAFAGTCPLKPGTNRLLFRAVGGAGKKSAVRTVTRRAPLRTLPKSPVRFDSAYAGEPAEDLVVRPGDTIRIRVKGSPGRKATYRIGSGQTHYPLFPVASGGIDGFYEGAYEIKPADRFVEARITCYLAATGARRSGAVKKMAPARVTVDHDPFPDVARIKEDFVRLRNEARNGAPLAVAPRGTYLNVVGSAGERVRVALAPFLHGWVGRDQIALRNDEPPNRLGVVRNLTVNEQDGATTVRIPLGLRVPFAVTENADRSLELTLFGVENRLNWITERTTGYVETVAAVAAGDQTCRLLFSLRGGRLLGYQALYKDTDLCIVLRRATRPSGSAGRPLAGRTILVDPGHGGSSVGTVGSTGLAEKAINLELCRLLQRHLEERGARVRLTRKGDGEVSLADRARQAEREGDLFVSIHNNSISLTSDPLEARGLGVFYYHPHSRDVAYVIYREMLQVEPRPTPYGVVTADFHVCREITRMPSVLIECLFLSHPEDEILLLDKSYAGRYMEAVATGIADWFFPSPAEKAAVGGE